MLKRVNSERGHVGSTFGSLIGIAAGIVVSLGIGFELKAMEIVGVVLFAGALAIATQSGHLSIGKAFRRLDRLTDDSDPDRDVTPGIRIEF
jgi:hypothetical protein